MVYLWATGQEITPRGAPPPLGLAQPTSCGVATMGPVGSLSPPLSTTIPVPFRHYANAAHTGKIISQCLVCFDLHIS